MLINIFLQTGTTTIDYFWFKALLMAVSILTPIVFGIVSYIKAGFKKKVNKELFEAHIKNFDKYVETNEKSLSLIKNDIKDGMKDMKSDMRERFEEQKALIELTIEKFERRK